MDGDYDDIEAAKIVFMMQYELMFDDCFSYN